MDKKYTYSLRKIAFFIAVWELLFWITCWKVVSLFGFFSDDFTGGKFTFLASEKASYFFVIPFFIALYFYQLYQRNRAVQQLKSTSAMESLARPVSNQLAFWRYFLWRNAIAFLVLALMQPAFGEKKVEAKVSGVELVFVLDISNSMNAKDMGKNNSRLDAAKRAVNQIINLSKAGKVGMVVFAGSVYPQLPLTPDKNIAKMYIRQLSTSFISNQGTHIGLALETATSLFSEDKTQKAMVLITDGEDHQGGIDEALALFKEKNINLFILGLGTEKGALVPADAENPSAGYLKDDLGRSVISSLNHDLIEEIAEKATAPYLISKEAYPNVNELLTLINKLKATQELDLELNIKANRYGIPLSISLFMFFAAVAMELLVLWRKRK